MRKINTLVIHCSASHQNVDVEEIRRWHTKERGWSDIGYHYVVTANGEVQDGRPIERAGAHVSGHNSNSIGICWVGGYKGVDNRTDAQKLALTDLTMKLMIKYEVPLKNLKGHRDFDGVTKSCPNFDVQDWWINEMNS